ncbi:MAG TPA: DNA alkylation repair protein [Clostridiales bacterium]|nr:DNA alkylation repair protein [Clostridiales bacterium]
MTDIQKTLFSMKDTEYRDFHARLVPNIEKNTIIGVRTPNLRAFAKEINPKAEEIFRGLPHQYYEENNLHAFLISQIPDFDECIEKLNEFLPYVDNWATCDGIRPKCFKKNKEKLILEIKKWLNSRHTYTVRFAIEMLMTHFLDGDFNEKYLKMVSNVKSDEYYINMMIAWYFATALAKKWDCTVKYLEEKRLTEWVHKKTIQKAIESYRITEKQKRYLKKLIIK